MEPENNHSESKEPQKAENQENPQQKSFRKGNYKSYDNSPFAPYERSQYYQEDFINDRVEQRMRMQEKAAEKMDFGITNKDKFITNKGKEQFYFYGDRVDYNIKKTQDKYDLLQKKNAGYKITNEQEDKYYKNYVDNVKPTSLDQIDQEYYENEGKRFNKQMQYNKELNEQINNTRAMRNKFEKDYNQRLIDAKKLNDEKYYNEEKKKEEKKMKEKNEFKNTNEQLIAQKNEAKKMHYKQNVEYDNVINNQVKRQMDYIEEKEYRRKEDKKNRYKQALDKQIDQQKIRRQREYDIENGNF
jgi:hypothetical protein